jgi:hypothetical protein
MKQECNMVDGVFCAFKERVMVAGLVVRGALQQQELGLGWKPVAKHYWISVCKSGFANFEGA